MTAPDLFTYAEGARLRDEGIARAASAQDGGQPGWSEFAYQAIVAVAKRQREVHVDDVLRILFTPPAHPNAWGGPWRRALKAKVIEPTGQTRPCTIDAKKRAHRYPVYRSLICEQRSAA